MKKRNIALLLFALCLGFTINASAQEIKIGYVDPQTILNKMPDMAAVQKKLQNYAEGKRQALADSEAAFQKEVQAFQQKSAVISDAAKKSEQAKLQQQQQSLIKLQNQMKQEVSQKQSDLMSPILNKIQNAINEVAKQEGLTYVLNTMTSNGDYIILYASDSAQKKYDITDKVMQKLSL